MITPADVLRHPMRAYCFPIAAGLLLGASTFMPWIEVGGQGFGGVPDLAGLWVLGLAALAIGLAVASIVTRKNSRHLLLLVGLLAFGILFLSERLMERAAAQRGWVTAQARAIVEGGRAAPVLDPVMAGGARLGLAASTLIALFGLTVVVKRAPRLYAEEEDDDA